MPEQSVATPAASVPRDGVSDRIVKGITDRANGKAPTPSETPPINGDQKAPVNPSATQGADPNAGKDKYVVDGKEFWLTPEQSKAYIQKGIAFEPRMDELARIKQETIQLQRAILNDPLTVIKNISKTQNIPIKTLYEKILDGDWPDDVKELIGQKYYGNVVEPLKLTPEQLKAREDAKFRAEVEKQQKTDAEMAIKRENYQKFQSALGNTKAAIAEAMKDSGLPNNDTPLGTEMARMVADVMRVAYFQRQTVTPKQAIEFVKSRIKAVQTAYYDHLDGEDLVKEVGEKNAAKIQAHYLKKAQDAGNPTPNVPSGRQKPSVNNNGERKGSWNMDDFHDYLTKRKQEG